MSIEELLELRGRAKSTQGDGGSFSPWLDTKIGFPAMCAKTAKRRLARSLPLGQLQRFGVAAAIDEAVDERGLPAWASPTGIVHFGVTPTPEPQNEQPNTTIEVTAGAPNAWPELTPDLATKVVKLADWVKTAESVRQLDARWLNGSTVSLKSQVKIMSEEAMDRLAELYEKKRMTLSEIEESTNN